MASEGFKKRKTF